MNDRGVTIALGGEEYELLLTVRATKEIAKRYGGLDAIAEKVFAAENFESSLEEIVGLITILANQSIALENLSCVGTPRQLITAEYVELVTYPGGIADYQSAIIEAINKGMARYITSEEPEEKNAVGGQVTKKHLSALSILGKRT